MKVIYSVPVPASVFKCKLDPTQEKHCAKVTYKSRWWRWKKGQKTVKTKTSWLTRVVFIVLQRQLAFFPCSWNKQVILDS